MAKHRVLAGKDRRERMADILGLLQGGLYKYDDIAAIFDISMRMVHKLVETAHAEGIAPAQRTVEFMLRYAVKALDCGYFDNEERLYRKEVFDYLVSEMVLYYITDKYDERG